MQYKLATALFKSGRNAEAIAHFEKAVELAPAVAEFRVGLAGALSQAGRFSDALAQLQKSIEDGGGRDWQSYDMLGAVYSKMGRPDEAIHAEQQAVDLAPVQDANLVRDLRARLAVVSAGPAAVELEAGLRLPPHQRRFVNDPAFPSPGSVTVTTRSAATSCRICRIPLGQAISISLTVGFAPRPKCTRESLEDA